MAIARVQNKKASQSSSLTGTVILDSVPVNGNAIIFAYRESATPGTLNLPAGFAWISGSPFGPTARITGFAYKVANNEDPSKTYVISSDTADTKTIIASEVSGLGIGFQTLQVNGPNSTSVTSINGGTTGQLPKPNCYLISALNLSGGSGGTNAVDNGFTFLAGDGTTNDTLLAADQIVSANTSLTINWSWLTSRTAQAGIAVFAEANPVIPISGSLTPSAAVIAANRRGLRRW